MDWPADVMFLAAAFDTPRWSTYVWTYNIDLTKKSKQRVLDVYKLFLGQLGAQILNSHEFTPICRRRYLCVFVAIYKVRSSA